MSEQQAVADLLRQGFSFPCSMCRKLWRAKARGADACEASLSDLDCGGPISGMSFPLYEGPLSLAQLATLCMRCGRPADKVASSEAQPWRFVGICSLHAPMLEGLVVAQDLSRARRTA